MDKMTFASYKFKPCDVIEGLNRYFAESKANRYRRVPLEIKNGVWTSDPDYRKDIVFINSYSDAIVKYPNSVTTEASGRGWKYYLICDPEEVVGVAINWLREEYDIFYTPGMEAPVEDFDIDEAAKEYEKATRKDLKEALQRRLHEAQRRISELEKSIAEKDNRIEALKADSWLKERIVKEQREFITNIAELLETEDPYIERQYKAAIEKLRTAVTHPNRYKWLYENLKTCIQSDLEEAASYEED